MGEEEGKVKEGRREFPLTQITLFSAQLLTSTVIILKRIIYNNILIIDLENNFSVQRYSEKIYYTSYSIFTQNTKFDFKQVIDEIN